MIKEQKQKTQKTKLEAMKCNLNDKQRHAVTFVSEKGASSWLAALPLKQHDFTLTKSEFRNGHALRYGWEPKNLPAECPCGEHFTIAHYLNCGKGGYTHMRHDEIRDTFANIMKDFCFDVEVEPKLQRLEWEFALKMKLVSISERMESGIPDSRERILTSTFLIRWPIPVPKK